MTFDRQESESGSEGSGSSQSDSESNDEGNERPQIQQRQPLPPPLSHYYPAMLSPPRDSHAVNNNPTTPTQKKKFEDRVSTVMSDL